MDATTIGAPAYDVFTARLPERAQGLAVRLLGPLEVVADGRTLRLGGGRQRVLLAALALRANEPVSREGLVDALWGERPPHTAVNALQVAVHGLRRLLGHERVTTHGDAYRLHVEPEDLDVERFAALLERSRGERPAAAAATLREALALWRGPALADLGDAPFALRERDRLEELRIAALEGRIEAEQALGAAGELVPELEALVREHPYRERLQAQLMLALYRAGRQSEALEAYRRARSALVDELGLDPGAELQALESAILRQDPSLEAPRPPARHLLPASPTPLVGRELELAALTALVRRPDVRLVTLTGAGGSGKTRLALAAAEELVGEFEGGAAFVDLSAVRDARLVGPTIARALGDRDDPVRAAEDLADVVRDRELLLVLDNFERVADAALVVGELLTAAPGLKALVTSRTVLHLRAEHEYPVPPLAVPRPDAVAAVDALARNEAVQLFVARARSARHDFALDERNAAAVAEICVALDGLPLALELAAARTAVLAPEELAHRLDRRLDLLVHGQRDLPARQSTMRAAIDWSYELLDEPAREAFAALAVFSGGFTPAGAEDVCGVDLDTLGDLVDQSLLRRLTLPDGSTRLRMLETIREYASERLAERKDADVLRRRHAEAVAALAEEAAPALLGPEAAVWLDRLELEHDNIRAALVWAADVGEHELGLRIAAALPHFWWWRGHLEEGSRRLAAALASADPPPALRARALTAAAMLADRVTDFDRAQALYEEALDAYRAAGDERGEGRTLAELGSLAIHAQDYDRARSLLEETSALFRAGGDTRALVVTLSNLAAIAQLSGDRARARELNLEALDLAERSGDMNQATISSHNLARVELSEGRWPEAGRWFAAGLERAIELGFHEVIAYCVEGCGELAVARGDAERGARLLGAGLALLERLGVALGPEEREGYERSVGRARELLGGAGFTRFEAEGRRLERHSAAEEARAVAAA